jgi:hypothetical protein
MAEADVMDKTIKYKDKDGNEKEATVGGILKKGEDHPAYDDAKQMADKGGEEEPKSKGLGKGDFERDFGGDTGTDADAQGEPPEGAREPDDSDEIATDIADELAYDFQDNYGDMSYDEYMEKGFQDLPNNVMDKLDQLSDDEHDEVMDRVRDILDDKFGDSEGEKDDEEEQSWDNAEAIIDASPDEILKSPQTVSDVFDDMEQAGIKVPVWLHMKGSKIVNGDGNEHDVEELQSAIQNIHDRPEDYKESIKVINGKKYKEVKEEKKVTEKHILREMYEKIGGK